MMSLALTLARLLTLCLTNTCSQVRILCPDVWTARWVKSWVDAWVQRTAVKKSYSSWMPVTS